MNPLAAVINQLWCGLALGIVCAHPDDEVIGLGAQLPKLNHARFLYTTNGAPQDGRDALTHKFASPAQYAKARRQELNAAFRLAGIDPGNAQWLEFPDQDASWHLCELVLGLTEHLTQTRSPVIITHPYEGGHPDHDATAFAVHTACRWLRQRIGWAPLILEMTSYHMGPNGIQVGAFLHSREEDRITFHLDAAQCAFKRELLACFITQQQTLAFFPPATERFRFAPEYDFTAAPHPGKLFYECFDWGMTGAQFRTLTSEAQQTLGIKPMICV